ncbi:MAG: NTP transferase domain-containing protein [Elusimicrobia bacterium]|nr:NTP transferase domain-containing protein [Elusimicrobiota bacterium]
MDGPACQAYLLAAGRGRRAGGPKAWRDWEGKPLLERQLEFLGLVLPLENVAVSIQESWLQRCRILEPRAVWVPVDPEAPALAAILALARALPLERWTFLYHVDMRVWEPELFRLLAERAAEGGAEAVVPVQGGRRGHPVLLSPGLRDSLLALNPVKDRLDVWLRSRRVVEVPVPYLCVHDNWNS